MGEFLKRALAPTALLAGLVAAIWSDDPMIGYLSDWIAHIAVKSAANAPLFILLGGLIAGWLVIPLLIRFLTWQGNWANYRIRLDAVYEKNKPLFHRLLNHAYEDWRVTHEGSPERLDDVIRQSIRPDKKSMKTGEVAKLCPALKAANDTLWSFCDELYSEIEAVNRSRKFTPRLLTSDECKQFTSARKELVDFWDRQADHIFHGTGLFLSWFWLLKIRPDNRNETLFVLLPFLETALGKQLNFPRIRSRNLFRLCLRGYNWHAANTSALKKPVD